MTFWVFEEYPTARVSKIFFPAKDNTVILSFNDGLYHNYSPWRLKTLIDIFVF